VADEAVRAVGGWLSTITCLFDSILCSTLFYGYGLGLYGKIHRPGLYMIVLAIWAFQLWISPIWLARFGYGPAEWLWRSLTYGNQPTGGGLVKSISQRCDRLVLTAERWGLP